MTDTEAPEYKDSVDPKDEREAEARREQNAYESESPAISNDEPDDGEDAAEVKKAEADDFFVQRTEEGDLQTITKEVPMYGEVDFIQLTYGKAEDMFGDVGNITQIGPKGISAALRQHVEDPDLEAHCKREFPHASRGQEHALNAHVIRNEMNPFAPMVLLEGLLEVSGLKADVSVDEQGNATVDFGEGNR